MAKKTTSRRKQDTRKGQFLRALAELRNVTEKYGMVCVIYAGHKQVLETACQGIDMAKRILQERPDIEGHEHLAELLQKACEVTGKYDDAVQKLAFVESVLEYNKKPVPGVAYTEEMKTFPVDTAGRARIPLWLDVQELQEQTISLLDDLGRIIDKATKENK